MAWCYVQSQDSLFARMAWCHVRAKISCLHAMAWRQFRARIDRKTECVSLALRLIKPKKASTLPGDAKGSHLALQIHNSYPEAQILLQSWPSRLYFLFPFPHLMQSQLHFPFSFSLAHVVTAHLSEAGLLGSATAMIGGGVGWPRPDVPLLLLSLRMAACTRQQWVHIHAHGLAAPGCAPAADHTAH
eukprot:1159074-Pelagomonas_calceolata.AAC.6